MNLLGALILGVGLLITIPTTYCVIYAAYRDIVRMDKESDIDITEHLVVGKATQKNSYKTYLFKSNLYFYINLT